MSRPSPAVYCASKVRHAPRWQALRAAGLPVVSTWVDEAGPEETLDYEDLWDRCVREAATASAVLLYLEEGETLKGALVEVGAALASGVPVYAVLPPGRAAGTWIHHRLVTLCQDLDEAVQLIKAAR